ncbi:MerR family transcriptional regulator [Aurantiacibacter gilvus]|uniref:MerR family transcriptional regulator n=1 Tax=Aurantiacibacter gilvus TaxID=3139141 RepID=A0ABU9IBW6_9SPHN
MSETSPGGARFNDGKAPDAMRTIGEVSAAFDIKPHVLRYWEQQFPMLQPLKRSGGRRLYRAADIALVEQIDRLVNREGYTLKGACKAIKEGVGQSVAATSAASAPVAAPGQSGDAVSAEALQQLRGIRDRLAAALDS